MLTALLAPPATVPRATSNFPILDSALVGVFSIPPENMCCESAACTELWLRTELSCERAIVFELLLIPFVYGNGSILVVLAEGLASFARSRTSNTGTSSHIICASYILATTAAAFLSRA